MARRFIVRPCQRARIRWSLRTSSLHYQSVVDPPPRVSRPNGDRDTPSSRPTPQGTRRAFGRDGYVRHGSLWRPFQLNTIGTTKRFRQGFCGKHARDAARTVSRKARRRRSTPVTVAVLRSKADCQSKCHAKNMSYIRGEFEIFPKHRREKCNNYWTKIKPSNIWRVCV